MRRRYVTAVTLAAIGLGACTYDLERAPQGELLAGDEDRVEYVDALANRGNTVAARADSLSNLTPEVSLDGLVDRTAELARREVTEAPLRRTTRGGNDDSDRAGTNWPQVRTSPERSDGDTRAPDIAAATPTPPTEVARVVDVGVTRAAPAMTPPTRLDEPPSTDQLPEPLPEADTDAAPSHAAFDALLRRYVSPSGAVDYRGLKTEHAALESYLQTLSADTPTDDWTRDEALAYWINAYNAATLDLVLDNYPLASIKDLDGGNPWDVKRVRLGDKTYSLNGIENDVIRPRFREPRIHFAVNCAAKGCPPLRNEAYTAERLDAQLREQTREFLRDDAYNRVAGDRVTLSPIFDWYGADFGDVAAYVSRYRDDVAADSEVVYGTYDWSLNAQ